MAKRSEHSPEELKALILDAAEIIVAEEGISALNARRLAREIGYTIGSIYMVFANMADLIMQINARTLDQLAENLLMVNDENDTQFLELWSMSYLSYARQNFNQWSCALKYTLPTQVGHETQTWYKAKLNNIFHPVEAKLAQIKPAYTKEQINYAARALSTSIQGVCVLFLNKQSDETEIKEVEDIITVLVRNFLRGWLIDTSE
ncbi:MAG: TetR/AcrR family transcriptional regulator [Methylococcales bacterium]|nr:MAG: TetR/AcrR family transcriptional regulator [Methylococcales bacterium]